MLRVVDTSAAAKKTYEVFNDRPPARKTPLPFGWPARMQEVGIGKATMYRSNKWKSKRTEYEDYKHIAESDNTVYAAPGFLRDWHNPGKPLHVTGPMVQLIEPMPQHFAVLAPLLGVQLKLFGEDNGYYEVTVAHGLLGGAEHPTTHEKMLIVYTKTGGVHMLITGEELDILKDGIDG
jgi:hypothetical protein